MSCTGSGFFTTVPPGKPFTVVPLFYIRAGQHCHLHVMEGMGGQILMINCAHNLTYVSRADTVTAPPVLMVPFFLCDKLKLFVTGHMDLRTNDCIIWPSLRLDVGV